MLKLLVERQIEFQNIHTRFAQHAEIGTFREAGDQLVRLIRGNAASLRYTDGLGLRGGRADMGIEAASRPGYRISGDGCLRLKH